MIPLSLDDDRRLVAKYIGQDNSVHCPAETWIELNRTSRGKKRLSQSTQRTQSYVKPVESWF